MDWLWAIIFVGIALFSTYAKARNANPVVEESEESSQKPSHSVKKKKKKQEYFTYESEAACKEEAPKTKSSSFVEEAPALNEEDIVSNFDLRQAIIYNTILQNEYISDLK